MPENHPFQAIRNHPNVCMTPHMAWGAYETRVRLLSEMAENIRAFLNGEHRNRVD
jgi:glycerate dehydrogenase